MFKIRALFLRFVDLTLHTYITSGEWQARPLVCHKDMRGDEILHFELIQLLHLNFDPETWHDHLRGSQLLTGWENSLADPTAGICLWSWSAHNWSTYPNLTYLITNCMADPNTMDLSTTTNSEAPEEEYCRNGTSVYLKFQHTFLPELSIEGGDSHTTPLLTVGTPISFAH